MKQPVLSVVDYDAWNRGYMPPTEHVLIDQLSYRGARVVTMSDWGEQGAWWLVCRGPKPASAILRSVFWALEADEKVEPSPDPYRWRSIEELDK
jgi:hypothetical protein